MTASHLCQTTGPKLLAEEPHMKPREWAVANISASQTMSKVNTFLKSQSERQSLPWTRDLAETCWAPYPTYTDTSARAELLPEYLRLAEKWPGVFHRELSERTHV